MKSCVFSCRAVLAYISVLLLSLSAASQDSSRPGGPASPPNLPARSRGRVALQALGDRLPEVAQRYGQEPEELEELLLKLEYVRQELETPQVTFGGHA